jgi:hypothetical protein
MLKNRSRADFFHSFFLHCILPTTLAVSSHGGSVPINGRLAELISLLAVNAFLFLLFAVALIGAGAYWLIARPVLTRVDKACDVIDKEQELREAQERLEKEEVARYRAQAEKELNDEFPRLHEGPR